MNEENYKMKMAIIAGASHALRYQKEHRMADESEIIQHITDIADEIIEKIEKEED